MWDLTTVREMTYTPETIYNFFFVRGENIALEASNYLIFSKKKTLCLTLLQEKEKYLRCNASSSQLRGHWLPKHVRICPR